MITNNMSVVNVYIELLVVTHRFCRQHYYRIYSNNCCLQI